MSELKQCSNCARWTNPLNSSACSYSSVTAVKLDFKVNKKGILFCEDFKSKLEPTKGV